MLSHDADIANMSPTLDNRLYVFVTTADPAPTSLASALAMFREDEGVSLILETSDAAALGFDVSLPMRRITLNVHSSLEGVGLTARVASALAERGIPCNMVAAFHHDHVFVPAAKGEAALAALLDIQAAARAVGPDQEF